jgi:hypothetical protein
LFQYLLEIAYRDFLYKVGIRHFRSWSSRLHTLEVRCFIVTIYFAPFATAAIIAVGYFFYFLLFFVRQLVANDEVTKCLHFTLSPARSAVALSSFVVVAFQSFLQHSHPTESIIHRIFLNQLTL